MKHNTMTIQHAKPILALFVFLVVGLSSISQATAKRRKFKVHVNSTPPHATIYVNDKSHGIKGYTPTALRLPKGTHKIMVELAGYESSEQFIRVKRRTKAVTFELRQVNKPAVLELRVSKGEMAGAVVSIDGKKKGELPASIALEGGRYLVEITKPGFDKWERWFELGAGQTEDVEVTLTPTKAKTGKLTVTVEPAEAGAVVLVDNQEKGPAPWSGKLNPGEYTVTVRAKDFTSATEQVTIASAQTKAVSVTLSPDSAAKMGTLAIAADPPLPDAFVVIDGKNLGPAPWKGDVPSGHHTVEVRAPNFGCVPQTIFVKGREEVPLIVKLYPTATLTVTTNVDKAEVFIDDRSVGFTPLQEFEIISKGQVITVQKKKYETYSETVHPQKGEVIKLSPTLVYAKEKGMTSYTMLKTTLGVWGKDRSYVDEAEKTGKIEDTPRVAIGLQPMGLANPYVGFGLSVSFLVYGLDGDLNLDLSPMLRVQIPVLHKGRRLVEFYLQVGGGLSLYFTKSDDSDNYFTDNGDDDGYTRPPVAFGWNVVAPAGVQFNVSRYIGLFVEGGWQIHRIYGDADSGEEFSYMWNEIFVGAGLTLIL